MNECFTYLGNDMNVDSFHVKLTSVTTYWRWSLSTQKKATYEEQKKRYFLSSKSFFICILMYSNCLYVTFTNISKTRQNHWKYLSIHDITVSYGHDVFIHFGITLFGLRDKSSYQSDTIRLEHERISYQKQKNPGSSCKKTSNNQTSLDDIVEWVNNCYESVYAVLVAILCRRILSISSSFTMNWYVDLSYSHRSHSHGRSIMNLMLTDERHLRLVYLCFPMCRQ